MSLWGNKDLVGQAGTVEINLSTEVITGTGTTFSTSGFEVSEGDIIVVGAGATYGHAVIRTVTSNTVASIATTQYLIPHPTTGIITAASYFITQRPISSIEDSVYKAPDAKSNRYSSVFGVDVTETGVAGVTTVGGKSAAYSVSHAGWVGVTTYTDMHGNFRVKAETLVAGSMISGDAADDTRYPDS
jgi:hypothetical protein